MCNSPSLLLFPHSLLLATCRYNHTQMEPLGMHSLISGNVSWLKTKSIVKRVKCGKVKRTQWPVNEANKQINVPPSNISFRQSLVRNVEQNIIIVTLWAA